AAVAQAAIPLSNGTNRRRRDGIAPPARVCCGVRSRAVSIAGVAPARQLIARHGAGRAREIGPETLPPGVNHRAHVVKQLAEEQTLAHGDPRLMTSSGPLRWPGSVMALGPSCQAQTDPSLT